MARKRPIAGCIYTPSDNELCRFTIPVRVKNITNERMHWAAKARYASKARFMAKIYTMDETNCFKAKSADRFIVTLTRHSTTTKRMDGDGLQAAMKPIRDGIADALGIDDGSDRIEWKYEQEKTGEYAVEATISPAPGKR